MNNFRPLSLLWLSLLCVTANVTAQPAWRDLPPEERHQLRLQMREHWAQEQGRDNVFRHEPVPDENRRRWQDIPLEERRRLRQEMRELRQREAQGEPPRERLNPPPPPR